MAHPAQRLTRNPLTAVTSKRAGWVMSVPASAPGAADCLQRKMYDVTQKHQLSGAGHGRHARTDTACMHASCRHLVMLTLPTKGGLS
jgi:hypothetical protein